jgi:uncharacterized protein YlxW (UPF0749 family)
MRSPGRPGLVLPAILMILGFLVAAAVAQERVREERQPEQVAELLDLIQARRQAIASLASETQTLGRRLDQVRATAGQDSAELRVMLERLERAEALAGVAPAAGSGLVVEVADSRDVPRTRGDVTDLRIQDVDLRLIVNALWRAGARAVAVNGRRVVSTTAIREAGDTILVNFSPVSSPYRVSAVGDPAALRSRLVESEIGRQFGVWEQVYGLGFHVRSAAEISVPGLGADAELSWASPVEEG